MNRHLHLKPMDGAIGAVKYRLEEMVRNEIKAHEPPLVRLKPYKVEWEEDAVWLKRNTYMENFEWYMWEFYRTGKRIDGIIKLHNDCEHYMRNNGGELIKAYLNTSYKTLEQAIIQTETITELWDGFYEWFQKKKGEVMEKINTEISKEVENKTGIALPKKPHSFGGVANLLKVYTKTMQEQGADIKSIAKMQFVVSRQAGVYLPDEFLTDVAVALDVEGEVV